MKLLGFVKIAAPCYILGPPAAKLFFYCSQICTQDALWGGGGGGASASSSLLFSGLKIETVTKGLKPVAC